MKQVIVRAGNISFGGSSPCVLIAGPCVIEDRKSTIKMAGDLVRLTTRLRMPYVFKASYDKANRTSVDSFRGPGLSRGLEILKEVRERYGVPVLTDVHEPGQVDEVAKVVDILQIPAFLCRQTDLLVAAGQTGKIVNVKKGQFLAPADMKAVVRKIESTGNRKVLLTDRGTTFGYNNLVTDFRSFQIMKETGYPVVQDVSHSVQQPGGLGNASGGKSEFIPLLARCGAAAGVAAIFMETHTNPAKALSDGPNMLPIGKLGSLLEDLVKIDSIVKNCHRG